MPARPSRLSWIIACLLALAPAGREASAGAVHLKIDFESPVYGGPGRLLSDHFLLLSGGAWHLFYTELEGPLVGTVRIGHARSTDLVHWTERPTVIEAGTPAWMSTGTWAPHVVASPGGGWIMLFTGRNDAGAQTIGALSSSDLDTWTLASPNPVWAPPPAWARTGDTIANSCRDPFVWFEGGEYSMLYTVDTNTSLPAIGRARSLDLLTWTDAGPFVIDSTSISPIDLESPFLAFANGRVELIYSRYWVRMLTATTSAGPWDVAEDVTVDSKGIASERVEFGAVPLLSRIRPDACSPGTAYVVLDSIVPSGSGYDLVDGPGAPPGWRSSGNAFEDGPAFGDGPAVRAETPAHPVGLRWMSSGERYHQPDGTGVGCSYDPDYDRTGTLRSPRFPLLGDSLWFRVMGAASIDSAYVRLLDACTGLELARGAGPGTNTLTPAAWSNAGRRGWPVEFELVDGLTRPGGVIGVDAIIDSTVGTYVAAPTLAINQTAPAGGENLTPGSTYTVRWTSFSNAGMDSHVVYVSYDDFATPPIRLQKRNGNQFTWNWTVPGGPQFNARIRVVAYAKNGVHDCDTSAPFTIAVVADGPGPAPGAGLALVARGSPGPTPAFAWSAPPGTRAWLRLYDVRGRLVRTLVDGADAGGGELRHAAWDGANEHGRPTAPGVVFAVLSGEGGARRTVSVVHLRR